MNTRKTAEELANRPYFIATVAGETTEENITYIASVIEIEGCFGQGNSREEAVADLKLAMVDFIESLLEDGLPIPEPTTQSSKQANESSTATYIFSYRGNFNKSVGTETLKSEYIYSR